MGLGGSADTSPDNRISPYPLTQRKKRKETQSPKRSMGVGACLFREMISVSFTCICCSGGGLFRLRNNSGRGRKGGRKRHTENRKTFYRTIDPFAFRIPFLPSWRMFGRWVIWVRNTIPPMASLVYSEMSHLNCADCASLR